MKQENPTSNPISASQIPPEYTYIIDTLIYHGYKAYLVGGCVRDLLLNLQPKDYDITTNATPEQVTSIFSPLFKILPTGISHGTVTLLQNNSTNFTCEVTTFRNDGKYLDNRRPSSVEFTDDLHTDLSRRDFTINAMAYNHHEGLIDPFHGIYDLQNNNIRCVGDSTERFQEDALRMMRAIRFAARFDFKICLSTAEAIYQNAHLIKNISMERIQSELNQILLTNPEYIHTLSGLNLLQYILPELYNCKYVEQNNPYHKYDVYNHIINSTINIEPTLPLRLTMLLHDIAKPIVLTTDEKGINHFYTHPIIGSDLSTTILKRLRYDNHTIMRVRDLILYHDADIHPNKKSIKRWLNRLGEETFRDLLKVKQADMMAQSELSQEVKKDKLKQIETTLEEVLQEQQCFSKKDLAINGNDLINNGIKEGKQIGIIIDHLVECVIDNPELNNRDRLIQYVKENFN